MTPDMAGIIEKKKEGAELSDEEIRGFIRGVTDGSVPDYQISALLMAICFRGMSRRETFVLTDAMLRSGRTMDLSDIKGVKVDKHSTGGVGDKTSLIVAPIAASCGVPIAKMSGRGLGFTGGTVDKLESIPGFRVMLDPAEFLRAVETAGMAIAGQTGEVAPADKKLYAIRDVTATVNSSALIASSIMSKKLASGSDAIVLDVKCGRGSFNKTLRDAEELGRLMVDIGTDAGKKTVALISGMDQPLGCAVGNGIEVMEAIDTLKCEGPSDISELSLTLAGYMIYCGQMANSPEEGEAMAKQALESGRALETFRRFTEAQGGDVNVIDDYGLFKQPLFSREIRAPRSGWISAVEADVIGLASQHLGAGRQRKEDGIDPSAGIRLLRKTGDPVREGEAVAVLFCDSEERLGSGALEAERAFGICAEKPPGSALIKGIIE